jgi:integrase
VRILRFKRERVGSRWRLVPGQWLTASRLSTHGIYDMTLRRGVEAGLKKKLRPHGLRHAGTTVLVNYCVGNAIPLTEAMKITRHKKMETLLRYVDRQGEKSRPIVEATSRITR